MSGGVTAGQTRVFLVLEVLVPYILIRSRQTDGIMVLSLLCIGAHDEATAYIATHL
jgi:hypothetical protein